MPNLTLMEEVVRAGAAEVMRHLEGAKRFAKGTLDFATEADLASERAMLGLLERAAPGVPRVFEESANLESVPPTCFVGDPLDGTIIASRGSKEWTVAVAFLDQGEPTLGAIYQPLTDTLVLAEKGNGCFINGTRVTLTPTGHGAPLVVGSDICYLFTPEIFAGSIMRLIAAQRVQILRSIGSAIAQGISFLRGEMDAFIAPAPCKIWDFAPTAAAVSAAGGLTLDAHGAPLVWNRIPMTALFATTQEVVEAVRLK